MMKMKDLSPGLSNFIVQIVIQQDWDEAQDVAFLTSSRLMPVLLATLWAERFSGVPLKVPCRTEARLPTVLTYLFTGATCVMCPSFIVSHPPRPLHLSWGHSLLWGSPHWAIPCSTLMCHMSFSHTDLKAPWRQSSMCPAQSLELSRSLKQSWFTWKAMVVWL